MYLFPRNRRRLAPLLRAVIEIAFIIFLFYSNLLMGQFTHEGGHGRTLAQALYNIFTGTNLLIGLIAALVGYMTVEYLRRKL